MGFIGSNFIKYVLGIHDDVEIINLDALSYGSSPVNLADLKDDPRYRFVHGDICERELVRRLARDIDVIVNFAAETHVDRSISNPGAFFRSNTLGTFTLLEAARVADVSFVQVSTDEVYGTAPPGVSFSEDSILKPSSPYSASKAAADMFVLAYYRTYGLRAMITRCSNNFGPYQFPEKLIPKTIIRALKNLPIPVYGSGRQVRDWIYVRDHCEAIDLVIRRGRPGEIYNISSGNEVEVLRVVVCLIFVVVLFILWFCLVLVVLLLVCGVFVIVLLRFLLSLCLMGLGVWMLVVLWLVLVAKFLVLVLCLVLMLLPLLYMAP